MQARELWECALKGAEWLVSQQEADGRWRPLLEPYVDGYYKSAWALSRMGCPTQAQRCLNYVAAHLLQPDGDVLPRKHPWHNEIHYLYSNAYLIIGGMCTGRYDVAQPALRFLLRQQQPAAGGLASLPAEDNGAVRCDTMSTSAAGLAALAAGRLDAVCCAANWFARLVKAQPKPEAYFLCTVDADGQIVSSFPEQDAAWRMVRTDQPNQTWYAVGLPLAFLVKAYQATGRREHLELALWFYAFLERCVDAWSGPSSGQAGWGCAELYRMTGETCYREGALQIGSYIAQHQAPNGAWNADPGAPLEPTHTWVPQDFDTSAESVLWLGEIASNILARDGDA